MAFLRRGAWLGRATPPSQVQQFLRSVRPVTTNHPLIRIGPDGDGGYLIPDDLEGITACFSPGVGTVADFELALAERGIQCFLADHSIAQPPVYHARFDFLRRHIGTSDAAPYMTLKSWVDQKAPEGDLILQMDIEGSECSVIADAPMSTLERFRIMVIEFHYMDTIYSPRGMEIIGLAFSKLLRSFDVIHIHANNVCPPIRYLSFAVPQVLEFTFLRKERVTTRTPSTTFPHPLDCKNIAADPDYPLPRCWYAD